LYNKFIYFVISRLGIDRQALDDHAAMSIDFKGEGLYIYKFLYFLYFFFLSYFNVALTFKATTDGVIHNLAISIELMQKREDIWRKKYEK